MREIKMTHELGQLFRQTMWNCLIEEQIDLHGSDTRIHIGDDHCDDMSYWFLKNLDLKQLSKIIDVQNTPKNRPSESQQNQGVKSSDLDVQKGNVL